MAVGIAIWLIWMAGLVVLAGLSSNPVTLNRRQFASADVVIVGNVADLAAGRVEVAATKFGTLGDDEITVVDLADIPQVTAGSSYIMPLKRTGNQFHVVPAGEDQRNRVVYPATKQVESQLMDVLRDISRRIAP